MRISESQIRAILATKGSQTPSTEAIDSAVIRLVDKDLVDYTTRKILAMNDREDLIASLKARIDSGDYQVSGEDIADAMIRRAIADSVS